MSAAIKLRHLGKDGPQVVPVGFGCMGLSAFYGTPETDEKRFLVLDKAFETGLTHWDSSDIYGDSEDLLAKWFKRTNKRPEIFLASKFACKLNGNAFQIRSDPEYVREACEKSLKRLGVDKIDLYYMHRSDEKTPIELTVKAMKGLKEEGKIGYLGLSEVSAETLRRACKVCHISAVQMEYSPFALEIEGEFLKTCRELGVAVVCYSPLGRGVIGGKYRSLNDFEETDGRRSLPRFSPENFDRNLVLVDEFQKRARKKGCSVGQLTLSWLLHQGEDIFLIPGTKRVENVEENRGGMDVQLTDDELLELRAFVDDADVVGERHRPGIGGLFANTPPL